LTFERPPSTWQPYVHVVRYAVHCPPDPERLPTGQNVVMLDGLIQLEPWEIEQWCRNHLGSGIDAELFRYGHLSTVIGIRLNSGLQS